jgi:hypothetical protein
MDVVRWMVPWAALGLAGCGIVDRDLRDPQTGQTATCTVTVMGDAITPLPADHPYCVCMGSHLAEGFVPVGTPRLLHLCRGLPD